jgi:DNA-binding CsgD family transcriptional regulator
MTVDAGAGTLARGEEALRAGDWDVARAAFEDAIGAGAGAPGHDGRGRARWWLGDLDGALDDRERAYVAYRKGAEPAKAAAIALWLSREYLEAVGNEPASNGWLARAKGLLAETDPGTGERGWLELTMADRAVDPATIRAHGEAARDVARRSGDADLEASALAHLGRASILEGDLEGGMTALDEAMTATTSGEVTDLLVFGDICCVVTHACEEAGEFGRLMRWNEVVVGYLQRNHHAPLMRWCGTCGAEAFLTAGDIATAEACLTEAIAGLEASGHRSRCVQPSVKLAELRVLQGRIEDAERLLSGSEDLPEATRAVVAIHRLKGEHAVAAALLLRRIHEVGDTVASIPLLAMLVEVQLAQGMPGAAADTAGQLAAIADRSGHPRYLAMRDLALGRVALAREEPDARDLIERALGAFGALEVGLEAARARIELARALEDEPSIAAREARLALETFERAGATREADEAAALLRELGGPARTGPKLLSLLSKREVEVLHLLGEGLSNAEIAARLFISTKTAGNHVSNVLSKLHLRSRSEAAAYAVRNLSHRPA